VTEPVVPAPKSGMSSVHPKVAVGTLVSLGVALIVVVLNQYVPAKYIPSAAVVTAFNAFVGALAMYFTPSADQ